MLIMLMIGCHAGGGPVIGFSRAGVRLGAEASGGLALVRGSIGGTTSVTSDEPRRFYITADPGFGLPLTDHEGDAYDAFASVGLTVGYATNQGFGDNWALGAWGSTIFAKGVCDEPGPVFSVAVGLRTLGDVTEVFVAPKINKLEIPCDI